MVFGVIAAGLGVGLAGLGIHGASRRAGRAATLVGDQTAQTLEVIRSEVQNVRRFIIEEAWPEVNKTIVHANKVLDRTEEFLIMGTFTTKILALLFFVLIFYVSKLALSSVRKNNQTKTENHRGQWARGGQTGKYHRQHYRQSQLDPGLMSLLEEMALWFISTLSMIMALLLVYQIFVEFFNLTLPNHSGIPFFIIVPSLTTVGLVLSFLKQLVVAIMMFLMFTVHVTIQMPIELFSKPAQDANNFMRTFRFLTFIFFFPLVALYFTMTVGLLLVWVELFTDEQSSMTNFIPFKLNRKFTVFETLIITYGMFYVASVLIYIIGAILVEAFMRPVWGCVARRNV